MCAVKSLFFVLRRAAVLGLDTISLAGAFISAPNPPPRRARITRTLFCSRSRVPPLFSAPIPSPHSLHFLKAPADPKSSTIATNTKSDHTYIFAVSGRFILGNTPPKSHDLTCVEWVRASITVDRQNSTSGAPRSLLIEARRISSLASLRIWHYASRSEG